MIKSPIQETLQQDSILINQAYHHPEAKQGFIDSHSSKVNQLLNMCGNDVNGALKLACQAGIIEVIESLITIHKANDLNGALRLAAYNGNEYICILLLGLGATNIGEAYGARCVFTCKYGVKMGRIGKILEKFGEICPHCGKTPKDHI